MSKNKLSLLGVTLLLGSTIVFSSLFIKPIECGVQNYTYKGIKTTSLNHSLNSQKVVNVKVWNGL